MIGPPVSSDEIHISSKRRNDHFWRFLFGIFSEKGATSYIIIVFCANMIVMSEYPIVYPQSVSTFSAHK